MNKHHINRIIKSHRDNPNRWSFVVLSADSYRTLCTAANNNIGSAADCEEILKSMGELRDEVQKSSPIAQAAILCLIVHEDCGYMLDSNPDELQLLSILGDQKAVLLYHACRILNEITV